MSGRNDWCEQLEGRRLLSASVDGSGLLTVEGTDKADVITVSKKINRIVVVQNGTPQNFTIAEVKEVFVTGKDGDDRIKLGKMRVTCTITGGEDDDVITGSRVGDDLNGDEGDDTLNGGGGDDVLRGDDGDDRLDGGDGDDRLVGGVGEDRLLGRKGDDALEADDGLFEDEVDGGPGNDSATVDNSFLVEDDVDDVEDVDD